MNTINVQALATPIVRLREHVHVLSELELSELSAALDQARQMIGNRRCILALYRRRRA